jgi:phytoene dehydrogenase-like protein
LREPFYERVVRVIEEYVPDIRSIIIDKQVLTPLNLERRFGITGGNIFHGEMSLDQMFVMRPVAGWARYRSFLETRHHALHGFLGSFLHWMRADGAVLRADGDCYAPGLAFAGP